MPDYKNEAEEALNRLIAAQQLGQALFEREAARRAREHGVDDARTQRMIRTAGGARAMLDALQSARAGVPVDVSAGADEAAVYGRVATDDLKGVSDLEIGIEDTNGRVMHAAGTAVTDASGNYAIRIPTGVAARLANKEYIVTARNAKGEIVYRAPATIRLELSTAVRADLEVGERPPLGRSASAARPPRPSTPADSTQPPKESPPKSVVYALRGRVTKADGKPAANVLVRVYDKDVRYDDLLGAALTSRKGEFAVSFRTQDFAEKETSPDLYFVVVNASEKVLLKKQQDVEFDEKRQGVIELTLSGE